MGGGGKLVKVDLFSKLSRGWGAKFQKVDFLSGIVVKLSVVVKVAHFLEFLAKKGVKPLATGLC